jgi:hypothetical protein
MVKKLVLSDFCLNSNKVVKILLQILTQSPVEAARNSVEYN